MHKIIVTGSGTDVGKTVVSAILAAFLLGDYWKPIECGGGTRSDTHAIGKLLDSTKHHVHPSIYSFQAPVSPHQAARLEGITIDLDTIKPPKTERPLVIETAGGIFVPLTLNVLNLDLFESWQGHWIVVSKHYLGSINHTLLTIEALKNRKLSLLGLIFNGENPDSEEAILRISGLPFIGRLMPEKEINRSTIQHYVRLWHKRLTQVLPF